MWRMSGSLGGGGAGARRKERVDPGRDLGADLGHWLLIMRNSRKYLRIVLDRCLEQKFREVAVLNFVHKI